MRATLVAVLAATLLTGACTDSSSGVRRGPDATGEPSTPATPDAPEVDFTVSVTPSTDQVVVTWDLTNRSGEPVLVTHRVPDSFGRLSDAPDTVYVLGSDTEGQVELAKRVLPVSSDAAGDSLPWIGVTELEDDEAVGETVRVPLPLAGYAPPGSSGEALPDPVTSVVFCVGVLVGRDDSWGLSEDDGTTIVDHGRAVEGQAVLCSDPVDLP